MKMLNKLGIYYILVAVVAIFYPILVYAENATTVTKCTLSKDNKKDMANNANSALIQMNQFYTAFNNKVSSSILDGKGNCSHLHSFLDGTLTSKLTFGSHSASGAEKGSQWVKALKGNYAKVSGALENTNLDIPKYQKENGKLLAKFKSLSAIIGKKDKYEEIVNNSDRDIIFVSNGSYCIKGKSCYTEKELLNNLNKHTQCEKDLNEIITNRNKLLIARATANEYLAYLSEEISYECSCDDKGKLIKCTGEDDTFMEDDVEAAQCKQLNEYQEDLAICPLCDLFEAILLTAQNLAKGAFNALADSFIKLLSIGLGIYIGYQTLLSVGSPSQQPIGKYLASIALQAFKVLLAFLLLSNPEAIYSLGITPIIEGGLDFGLSLIPVSSASVINEFSGKYSNFDGSNTLLPAKFLQKVMGAVEGFNKEAGLFPAIGRSLICNAWVDAKLEVLPHTSLLVSGLFIYIFGLLIIIAVGFYLLDCSIQLGITCCLVPFLIACWPFKITSGYTKTGWNMIMNTFFNFVMMGIVISTGIALISQALSTGTTPDELAMMINTNDIAGLEEITQLGSIQTLILLSCSIISLKLIKDVGSLANKFAAGAGISLGADLGGTLASLATSVAKGGGSIATKAITKQGKALAEASGISGAAKAGKNKISQATSKVLGSVGIGKKANMGAKGRDNSSKKQGNNDGKNNAQNNQSFL